MLKHTDDFFFANRFLEYLRHWIRGGFTAKHWRHGPRRWWLWFLRLIRAPVKRLPVDPVYAMRTLPWYHLGLYSGWNDSVHLKTRYLIHCKVQAQAFQNFRVGVLEITQSFRRYSCQATTFWKRSWHGLASWGNSWSPPNMSPRLMSTDQWRCNGHDYS